MGIDIVEDFFTDRVPKNESLGTPSVKEVIDVNQQIESTKTIKKEIKQSVDLDSLIKRAKSGGPSNQNRVYCEVLMALSDVQTDTSSRAVFKDIAELIQSNCRQLAEKDKTIK